MRDREARDRDKQPASRARDEQQAGNEQQMIEADPDMLDTQHSVFGSHGQRALALRHDPGRHARAQHSDMLLSIDKPYLQ